MTSSSSEPNAQQSAKEAMASGVWNAHLHLRVAQTPRGVRVVESDRRGPLYTQKALYPEGQDLPHLYLLHPPGGLVSGDHLDVRINLDENASVLLTSPGAGRLYRARADGRSQRQDNRLKLKSGSSLEWFPMETLVYSGARAETHTQVHLEPDSHFIGWDICALGLPSSGAPFDNGLLRQGFEIYQQGVPKIIERIKLDAKEQRFLNSSAGLAGMTCNALFVAGPFDNSIELEQLKASLVEVCNQSSTGLNLASETADKATANAGELTAMMGVTQLGDWLIVRYLGESTSLARRSFEQCWTLVRPVLLKREACLPRIWAC